MAVSDYYTIQWNGDHVSMIDQRKLPFEEKYVQCCTYQDIANAISMMIIRGAPAIGVAGAMGVALGSNEFQSLKQTARESKFHEIADILFKSRPTAVNLRWALRRMERIFNQNKHDGFQKLKNEMIKEAISIFQEDITINRSMAEHGQSFIKSGMTLLTYCNTGTLATAGYGTALGVIRYAHEIGKKISVYVSETRPYLQGARLTSWELKKLNIPQTLITDNMVAYLMYLKKVDAIFVGADRIAANGDVANKIGTYMVARLAYDHGLPFYVVAPTSTIDFECPSGEDIPIEERSKEELIKLNGISLGLEEISVFNPSFDITPSRFITAIITEKGILVPPLFKPKNIV